MADERQVGAARVVVAAHVTVPQRARLITVLAREHALQHLIVGQVGRVAGCACVRSGARTWSRSTPTMPSSSVSTMPTPETVRPLWVRRSPSPQYLE